MDNRGSKSGFRLKSVKEQRIYGSWRIKKILIRLRFILGRFKLPAQNPF